jgi:hypothetical protein
VPAIPLQSPSLVIEWFEEMDILRAIAGVLNGSNVFLPWNEREPQVIGWFFAFPIVTFSLLSATIIVPFPIEFQYCNA